MNEEEVVLRISQIRMMVRTPSIWDEWNLLGTHYYAFIDEGRIQWWFHSRSAFIDVSFEEVLENVEPDLQKQLLYHLDLFRWSNTF